VPASATATRAMQSRAHRLRLRINAAPSQHIIGRAWTSTANAGVVIALTRRGSGTCALLEADPRINQNSKWLAVTVAQLSTRR